MADEPGRRRPLTKAGTISDDPYSLPAGSRHHTHSEAFWGRIAKLFQQTREHGRACHFQLSRPGGVVDRNHRSPSCTELRVHLAGNLGTDDFLPTTGNTTEDEGVLHTGLAQQPVDSGTDGHRWTTAHIAFARGAAGGAPKNTIGPRPAAVHCSSLPARRRTTSFGVAPGGNPRPWSRMPDHRAAHLRGPAPIASSNSEKASSKSNTGAAPVTVVIRR